MNAILDMIMCVCWIGTYTMVFIGTIKYKYPLISPIAQILGASFEFSVFISFIYKGSVEIDYVFATYLYWTILELAIIVTMILKGYIPKNRVVIYVVLFTFVTAIMCNMVIYRGQMFFFSYFNALIGEVIWLLFIKQKNYPVNRFVFIMFAMKFIGDTICLPVYLGAGSWIVSLMCVLVPILDFLFLACHFEKRYRAKKAKLGLLTA